MQKLTFTHTHKHTLKHINIYIHICDKIRELGYSPGNSTRCTYMHMMKVYLYTNVNPYYDTIFQVCIIIDSRPKSQKDQHQKSRKKI